MTIFRWVIGVIAGLMAVGSALSFVLFMAFDIKVWLERARTFRRTVEVWGRVILTIIHW